MTNYIGRSVDAVDNISTLDNLTFNGSDATFNLTQNSVAFVPVSADALQIQIDGIIQSGNYTCSGSQVTFDFTPSGSSVCNGIKHFGVGVLTSPSDGSVTATKIGTDAVIQAKIADEAIDEARMQISNAGTNGQYLQKQSGNTGGLTWADAGATADNYFATSGLSSKDLGTGLHIKTGDSGLSSAHTQCDELVIESDGHTGMTITSPSANQCKINFADTDDNAGGISYNHNGDKMIFRANDFDALEMTDTNFTFGGGVTKFGTSTDFGGTRFHIKSDFNSGRGLGLNSSNGASGGGLVPMIYFGVENSAQGSVNAGGGSVQYNTSSDYRRKENIENLTSATDRVKELKPYRFNFIDDPNKKLRDGFLAHEVTSIVPEAVSGEKDAVEKYKEGQDIPEGKNVGDNILDEEGNTIPDYQGLDHSKLVPLLTGALQEALTKIETLEAKVETLENA